MYFFLSNNNWRSLSNQNIVQNVVGTERWIIGEVLNVIRLVGSGIALIMLTWMSLSYFLSDGKSFPGDIQRKADVKGRQLTFFAMGVAIFIGASNILYFIVNLIEDTMTEVFK